MRATYEPWRIPGSTQALQQPSSELLRPGHPESPYNLLRLHPVQPAFPDICHTLPSSLMCATRPAVSTHLFAEFAPSPGSTLSMPSERAGAEGCHRALPARALPLHSTLHPSKLIATLGAWFVYPLLLYDPGCGATLTCASRAYGPAYFLQALFAGDIMHLRTLSSFVLLHRAPWRAAFSISTTQHTHASPLWPTAAAGPIKVSHPGAERLALPG